MIKLLTISFLLYIHSTSGLKIVVSGYNSRLAVYNVDGNSVEHSLDWEVGAAGQDMTWIQIDGDQIWAGHEVGEYEGQANSVVSRWQVSADGSSLQRQEYVSTGSVYTAHLLVDKDKSMAYAANYGGSTFSVITLSDGALGELNMVESYGENCRDASHPHQTYAKDNWVWVVDLGCDKIWHYALKDGSHDQLEATGSTTVRAGAGPRHMIIHPTKDLMFLLCELQSFIQVYKYDSSNGMFDLAQELELSSTPGDAGAEILVGPSGQFVYGSSRGSGVVLVYSLEEDDTLVKVQEYNLSGTWPRSMAIRDSLMVVADQYGEAIQVLNIDPVTGMLNTDNMDHNTFAAPPGPSFVGFME